MSDNLDVSTYAEHFLNFTQDINITEAQFECPVLPVSWQDALSRSSHEERILTTDAWLHGLLSVFIVSICAVFGCFLVPLLEKYDDIFTYMMLYLISLAVSALSGAALLVLIPEGLGIDSCDQFHTPNLIACFGIISTFFVHQLIKALTGHDEAGHGHPVGHKDENKDEGFALLEMNSPSSCKKGKTIDIEDLGCSQNNCPNSIIESFRADCNGGNKSPFEGFASSNASGMNNRAKNKISDEEVQMEIYDKHQHGLMENLRNLKSVGWLCLVGDGVHNFLDGVAIGATFAIDINRGWQVTIAIFAEEFPHELGDFAVLIRSGLTFPQAVAANLISAATCLLGFFLGMFHGDYFGLSVFSWMGGVFLFIALSSMLPEVEEHIADLKKVNKTVFGKIKIVSIALAGLFSGYMIVYYCGQMDFEGLISSKTDSR